jgi:hypothetical protein
MSTDRNYNDEPFLPAIEGIRTVIKGQTFFFSRAELRELRVQVQDKLNLITGTQVLNKQIVIGAKICT